MKNRKITDAHHVSLNRAASKRSVMKNRSGKVWLAGLFALVMTACASMQGSGPQGLVKQRAAERWSALVSGEYTRAYSYNTPGFRDVVTSDGFRGRFGGAARWVDSEVVDVKCLEDAKCEVKVRVDYKPLLPGWSGGSVSTYIDETWLKEGGQWWIFLPLTGK
jgi:hypothetical protein